MFGRAKGLKVTANSDFVFANKIATLRRSVARAREEYAARDHFATDFTHQDAAILNVERACQAAITVSSRLAAHFDLNTVNTMRDGFRALAVAGLIPDELGKALESMVGFRNIAVHAYQDLNLEIVIQIITQSSTDLLRFADIAEAIVANPPPTQT